jgi:hypothetical protein
MKLIMCFAALAVFFFGNLSIAQETIPQQERFLIFSGKVLEIGPSPGFGSGGVTAYQMVKYKVLAVCKGTYHEKEIIADHILLQADDLSDLKVGDKVCVGVMKTKDIDMRWNDNNLRKESDVVDMYYIVHDTFIRKCQCSGPDPK